MAPELVTPADDVLDEPGLGLVDPHAAAGAGGLIHPVGGEALLVDGVAALVEGGEYAGGELLLVVVGRDADVFVVACGEGVLGLVYPAAGLVGFDVVSDRLGEGLCDPPLGVDGYLSRQEVGFGLTGGVPALLDDPDEAFPHPVEDPGDGL